MLPVQTDRPTASTPVADLNILATAQRDMRTGYMDGAPGVLVSGLVWAIAGCVATWLSPQRAVWALFIGGVFIHPGATDNAKILKYNHEATKLSIQRAMKSEPSPAEVVAGKDTAKHPFAG